ncbi:hypothetical protein Q7460_06895 [Glaesserella parasuis]|uniref:Phage associated protein n=1 Tax=Glaesserella parasuis TaxID=738 RepID=A0AAX1M5X2_GLAPU|nr:hypothetical protein [Glaesserella parasuis]MDO9812352.1 hypothetical protein [Glaesserella parasuis]MDO9838356.1 hypothetical protein [Glaesserella parasuis]MDO9846872.1 hypothetical protein [Glaesserella parasuis]MDO9867213.1 hypothetical protein [Glaesserella parasuis]MDO9904880.1 hypothetical protein [Glaesserella parasuis]
MSELTLSQEQNAVALAAKALTQDLAEAHEAMGMVKAFSFVQKLATVATLKTLAEIKEAKKYKGLGYIDQEGKLATVATWEDYCKACGSSARKIDEDLQNLNAFGEEFFEISQRVGLTVREMRKLRQLPSDARAEIIDADYSEATDKEELIEKIEDLTAKHVREKDALTKQLETAKGNYEAQSKVMANKDRKINELSEELAKKKHDIETRTPDKKGGDLRKETSQIAYGAEAILRGQVGTAFDALLAHSEESGIDHTQFMSGVVAEIELILIELKDTYGLNDAPSASVDWSGQSDDSLGDALDAIIAQKG